MKKFALLFVFSAAFASPVGNPASPELIEKGIVTTGNDWVDFRIGYEGDFVTDGRLNQREESHGRVDFFKQYTNSGTLTFNMFGRVDIYGVWGRSRSKADWRFQVDDSIHQVKLKTNQQSLWAVGTRAILYEWWHLFLGMGGRYSSCRYQPDTMTFDGTMASVSDTRFLWREWQVNLDFSYTIRYFTPYVGVKYSNVLVNLGDFSFPVGSDGLGSNQFINRIPVGLYLGCGISNGKYFMVNVEGRLIDEEAITVSCDMRF